MIFGWQLFPFNKMRNFWLLLFPSVLFSGFTHVNAQQTIQGTVVNAKDGEAVVSASIRIISGEKYAGFGASNDKGTFNIKITMTDSLQIIISSMGYKTVQQAVEPGATLHIKMEEEAFTLNEVMVRPGRVWGNRDTINYDVDRFLSPQDRTLKDVLTKLPGIDVDEKGKISYQGKDVSNMYVEGMDPVGGRYNQITNNLRADAVQTVQVMENHQPVKMLEDLVASDDIALNLKLKAEFQAVWMCNVEGGIGVNPLLWYTSDNTIRLSRTNQSIFSYKGNNTGHDFSFEQLMLGTFRISMMEAPATLSFLAMPSIMAPLKNERVLFNNVQTLSANRLYKLNETTKIRFSANYTHDERKQERGSETIYYQLNDTVQIKESSHTKLYKDETSLNIHLENNASDKFLTNNFAVSGQWNKGVSHFTGNPSDILTGNQRLTSATIGANNDFRTLWGKQGRRYEVKSFVRYDHQPEALRTDLTNQKISLNRLYTDNSFNVTGRSGYFIPQLSVGFTGDINNVQNGITPYLSPNLQWNKEKWQTRFALPVIWTDYPDADFSRLSARPSANLSYKPNYAWRFTLSAGFREQYGNLLNFYPQPYHTDYRRIVQNPETLPIIKAQNYMVSGEYKKIAVEFFSSLSISYMNSRNSHIYEQTFENGYITVIPYQLSNTTSSRRIAGTLSKGFYDIKLQTSLSAQLSQSQGEQVSSGKRLPYLSNRISLEPKINWNYFRNFIITYQSNFSLTDSKISDRELDPLLNIVQKFQFSYILPSIEASLSTEQYYNEVNNTTPINNYFIDCSFRYKHNKWRFSADLNNLLNKRQYAYTEYAAIRSYSSWINIRSRELLLGLQYRF
jgi:hypothetical protein